MSRPARLSASSLAAAAAVLAPALLALAACGGPGGAHHAAPADVPRDLLTRSPEGLRAVVDHDGVAYLFVRQAAVRGEDETEPVIELPECWAEGGDEGACPKTAPVPAGTTIAPLPATVTVVGTEGLCTAQVGAPVLVNTSGCEPSAMVAAPLSGCPLEIAPVARVDGAFDRDLRWRPAPSVETVPLFADPAKLADPVHRRYVSQWLGESELKAGAPHEGLTADVHVDAGAERLESLVAGFLVGDGDDECQWQTGSRGVVGLRRGDVFTPLAEDTPVEWDGALVWHGRVVGIAAGLPRDVRLLAVTPDGSTTPAFEADVWWDNEECTQGGWAYVEYPCGP